MIEEDQPDEHSSLTFSQRHGLVELPSLLKLQELSAEVRNLLWSVVYQHINQTSRSSVNWIEGPWHQVFQDFHVRMLNEPIDEFEGYLPDIYDRLKYLLFNSDYNIVFDVIEFIMRHPRVPSTFSSDIGSALSEGLAAYQVLAGKMIGPRISYQEGEAVSKSFIDIEREQMSGAKSHLRSATQALNSGDAANAVREVIQAVESVARKLVPESAGLGPALTRLEKHGHLNAQLKDGMKKIYGFTNSEEGIRHPLLDGENPKVSMEEALYMYSSCAAFISYMINTARSSGIIQK